MLWVMVEVHVKKDLSEVIEFLDEWGHKVIYEVQYKWRPIHYNNCRGMGHDTEKCKRLLGIRKEWVPKAKNQGVVNQNPPDKEGFVTPKNAQPRSMVQPAQQIIPNENSFQALNGNKTEPGSDTQRIPKQANMST